MSGESSSSSTEPQIAFPQFEDETPIGEIKKIWPWRK